MVDRTADSAAQLGRGIRKLRKQKGWNQDRLSEKAGVNRATISLLEAGKSNPSFLLIESLADALGTTVLGVMDVGRISRLLSNQQLNDVVADNVKERRMELGLSRIELGQRVNLLPQYISTTENARRLPSLKNCIKLATALECDLYLLFFSEEKGPIKSRSVRKLGALLSPEEVVCEMKRIRTEKGWSRVDVGRAGSLNPNHLRAIEVGDIFPTIPTLLAFCDVMGIAFWDLTQN